MSSTLSPSGTPVRLAQPSDLQRLPPFPAAASRLLQLLSRDDFEPAELVTIMKTDPMFAAELLRTVNSPRFARMQQVTGIQHAAALLGRDTLRSFTLAVSTRMYLGTVLKQESLARVWQHSVATALCAELLVNVEPSARQNMKETAYVGGLLHDVGCLGLMVLYPKEYTEVLALAAEEGADLRQLEVDRFGMDHCMAGQWIAENWKFGREIEDVALHHHEPVRGEPYITLEIVKLAVQLADAFGWSAIAGTALPPADAMDVLPAHFRQRIRKDPGELFESIGQRIEAFSHVGAKG